MARSEQSFEHFRAAGIGLSSREKKPLLWLMLAASLLSCAPKKQSNRPRVSAAESAEAQAEVRRLEEEWELAGRAARQELRPELERFLEQHPDDSSADRVRLMLAQIALSERRLGGAEELLRPLLEGKRGSSRDEAQVVMAAVEVRREQYDEALKRLAPLEGKLLSRDARDQFFRERITAALKARRWRLAVDSMNAWLKEDGAKSSETKTWVQDAIIQVPARALSRLLVDWAAEEQAPEDQSSEWLHREVIEHLARVAIQNQDAQLSRDLLENSPPWLRASEQGDQLALLAALAQKDAQVAGRSVGVVLGGNSDKVRRRNVRVAAGLLYGLKHDIKGKRQPSDDTAIQFFSAEDRGSVTAALGTLSGLGSTLLVGGVDDASAQAAMAFAGSRQVPVMVMHQPANKVGDDFAFMLGASQAEQQQAITQALPDVKSWGHIGGVDLPCESLRTTLLPWSTWREEQVSGLSLLGDLGCLRRVVNDLRAAHFEGELAVGLVAAPGPFPAGLGLWNLQVGSFPRSQVWESDFAQVSSSSSGKVEIAPEWDWFFCLGFDAAQLVKAALKDLPETAVTEQAEVRARHLQAKQALQAARVDLLTTEARGFSQGTRMQRTLRLVQAKASSSPSAEP